MSDKPILIRKEVKQIPFWQILYNEVTNSLKNERYVKAIYKHTFAEINEMISKGQRVCDDCDKLIELKLPKNYEELGDIIINIINPNCCFICEKCHIKTIKEWRVLADEKYGWYPDPIKLLKEAESEH